MIITQGLGGSTVITLGLGEESSATGPSAVYIDPVDPRRRQFGSGIKMANVPRGKADFVVVQGTQVYHINNVQNFQMDLGDKLNRIGVYGGVVKFRFRSHRNFPVPSSVNQSDGRNADQFSNPVFSFTGR